MTVGRSDGPRDSDSGDGVVRSAAARDELRADCARCAGLCCVAPAFSASSDFAIDKPAGRACPNLGADCRCGIHETLRERGFAGCAAYDCFGAGQRVVQATFAGRDWRQDDALAAPMFHAFDAMCALHQLAWYLDEAVGLDVPDALRRRLEGARTAVWSIGDLGPDELADVDVDAVRERVNPLLAETSALVRAAGGTAAPDHRGALLIGADLRDVRLRAASLRGALLVGADLRDVDLTLADLTGADLRGARLEGARLAGALFVTQRQIDSAVGDGRTTLPWGRSRPGHWGG